MKKKQKWWIPHIQIAGILFTGLTAVFICAVIVHYTSYYFPEYCVMK